MPMLQIEKPKNNRAGLKHILRKIKSNECMKSGIIIAHYRYIVVRIDGGRE